MVNNRVSRYDTARILATGNAPRRARSRTLGRGEARLVAEQASVATESAHERVSMSRLQKFQKWAARSGQPRKWDEDDWEELCNRLYTVYNYALPDEQLDADGLHHVGVLPEVGRAKLFPFC